MPKLKSNRGAAKRFKPTRTGRFKHRQSFKNHILTKKSSKRKRQLRGLLTIHAADQKAVQQMLPYSRGKSAFRSPHPSPLPEGEGIQESDLREGEGITGGDLPEGETH